MKRILKEPLFHFLLLGAALFAGYRLVNRTTPASPQAITVSPGQIEHMATAFARTWQRPANADELKGLIDQFVREEIFSREAMKLGLDQNDVIIRRRLQQKMEFIADDMLAGAEPTEADLAAYLASHPEPFRQDQQLTFRQVYLNPEKRGDRLAADASGLLAQLKTQGGQAEVSALGDQSLLPPNVANEPRRSIVNGFGEDFTAAVCALPVGEWSGPVVSSFGTHLVLVDARTEGRVSTLAEVRPQVQREWENDRRTESNRRFLEMLLKQYAVTIVWPKQGAAPVEKK